MRKNTTKKIWAAILAVGMVMSVLSGCANEKPENSSDAQQSSTEKTVEESSTEAEETVEESTSLLPYTGEEVEFSYFWFDLGVDDSDQSLPINAAVNEMFGNVKLKTEILPITDYYTKVPLLLAGGDIPDIMIIYDVENTLSTYGQNGVFLDWAPLMEEYMPNLYKYSQELAMFEGLRDSEGHIYGLPIYVNSQDYIMQTWIANTDILAEAGVAVPETQEDFLAACRAVKEKTGVTPLQRRYGMTSLIDSISMMYSNGADRALSYYPEEGIWDFGPTREDSQLKSFLTFMNTLWKEELIDHEINTMSAEQYNDYVKKGQFAFTHDYITTFSTVTDFVPAVIKTPECTASVVSIDSARDAKCVWAVVANADTENPELLASCIDAMFSEEVATLENYGIEGVSYEIGEDGQKYFTDSMKTAYNNYSGEMSLADLGADKNWWLRTFGVTDVNATRLSGESKLIYDGVNELMAKLDSGEMQARYNYGYPTLTEDENTQISDIYTPVQTYLDECILKFIIGDMDIEKDWDEFMTKLQSYGDMDKVCEILNSKEMLEFAGEWR